MAMAAMIVTPPPGGFKTGDYVVRRYGNGGIDASGAYVAAADVDLTVVSVDDVGDALEVTAHGLLTGRGPLFVAIADPSVDTLPAPLVAGVPYWVIVVDADHIQLAATAAAALVPTPIDLTDIGAGTPPALSNGFLVPGSVQALGNEELGDNDEGQTGKDIRRLFTVADLRSRTKTTDPDIVELDGNHYRVNTSNRYGTLSGGHSLSVIEKVEVP